MQIGLPAAGGDGTSGAMVATCDDPSQIGTISSYQAGLDARRDVR